MLVSPEVVGSSKLCLIFTIFNSESQNNLNYISEKTLRKTYFDMNSSQNEDTRDDKKIESNDTRQNDDYTESKIISVYNYIYFLEDLIMKNSVCLDCKDCEAKDKKIKILEQTIGTHKQEQEYMPSQNIYLGCNLMSLKSGEIQPNISSNSENYSDNSQRLELDTSTNNEEITMLPSPDSGITTIEILGEPTVMKLLMDSKDQNDSFLKQLFKPPSYNLESLDQNSSIQSDFENNYVDVTSFEIIEFQSPGEDAAINLQQPCYNKKKFFLNNILRKIPSKIKEKFAKRTKFPIVCNRCTKCKIIFESEMLTSESTQCISCSKQIVITNSDFEIGSS